MSEPVKLTKVFDADEQNLVQQKPNVGQQLAQVRLQQQLSLEQVAGQLKWSVRQIADIEASNYAAFPDMLSVRGIVRTYAKLLKIDATSLLEELPHELGQQSARSIDRPALDTPFPTKGMQWRNGGNPFKSSGLILVLILCLVVVFVYRDKLAGLGQSVFPTASETKPLSSEATPASQPAPSVTPPAVTSTAANPALEEKSLKISDQIEVAPPKAGSPAISASSPNALVLHFRQDSWLQVKHADGSVLVSHLYKAGSEQLVDVNEPLTLIVGNAPGVEATLRGQTLDLPAVPGSNVVNLTVR